MIKERIISLLQRTLGMPRYLFLFSLFHIWRINVGISEKALRTFMGAIKEKGIILDIGANVGAMSVVLAKKFPESIIYAFEPMTANMEALERTFRFYDLKNAGLFPYALGNQNGEVTMVMPLVKNAYRQGFSHILQNGEQEEGEISKVAIHKLDDVLKLSRHQKVVAIKIDVENFEWEVLQGAQHIIRTYKPIILCELWNDEKRNSCFHFMQDLHYRVHVLEGEVLVPYTEQSALDFFFLPE